MKKIIKGLEPNSLTRHRGAKFADYDNYENKDDLRAALVRDQRGICCYCMGSIEPNGGKMKIEHWKSQSNFPNDQLIYANLLGACLGNQGEAPKNQHCDTCKGDDELGLNPASLLYNIEETIQYLGDGRIKSINQNFDLEINNTLNLNASILVNRRKAALSGFTQSLSIKGQLKKGEIKRLLSSWRGDNKDVTDTLQPFCQVIVYWLDKRLART
jgi:uncharacterized protein (TIGR02646 family)